MFRKFFRVTVKWVLQFSFQLNNLLNLQWYSCVKETVSRVWLWHFNRTGQVLFKFKGTIQRDGCGGKWYHPEEVFLKWWGAKVFRKICPPLACARSLKLLRHLVQLLAFRNLIANGAEKFHCVLVLFATALRASSRSFKQKNKNILGLYFSLRRGEYFPNYFSAPLPIKEWYEKRGKDRTEPEFV